MPNSPEPRPPKPHVSWQPDPRFDTSAEAREAAVCATCGGGFFKKRPKGAVGPRQVWQPCICQPAPAAPPPAAPEPYYRAIHDPSCAFRLAGSPHPCTCPAPAAAAPSGARAETPRRCNECGSAFEDTPDVLFCSGKCVNAFHERSRAIAEIAEGLASPSPDNERRGWDGLKWFSREVRSLRARLTKLEELATVLCEGETPGPNAYLSTVFAAAVRSIRAALGGTP